jgi:hypothetical protein
MSRKKKLIWDFRGPASKQQNTQNSFEEYIAIEKLPLNITGFETQSASHCFHGGN